jgi:hypothetical protein
MFDKLLKGQTEIDTMLLQRLYVGSSTIWNNVCHISKNYVDNRRAENWHLVATENLCKIFYKLKQRQTGLKIEITNHIRIGDVALRYYTY